MSRFFKPCSRYQDLRYQEGRRAEQDPPPDDADEHRISEVCLIDEEDNNTDQQLPNGLTMSTVRDVIIDAEDPTDIAWFARDLFIALYINHYLADRINFVKLFYVSVRHPYGYGIPFLVCARTPDLAKQGLEDRIFPLLAADPSGLYDDSVRIQQDSKRMNFPVPAETLTSLVTTLTPTRRRIRLEDCLLSPQQAQTLAGYQGPLEFHRCTFVDDGGSPSFKNFHPPIMVQAHLVCCIHAVHQNSSSWHCPAQET